MFVSIYSMFTDSSSKEKEIDVTAFRVRQLGWVMAAFGLVQLQQLDEFNARRHATDVFFSTKYQEIADLLADAPQRNEAYELLVEMDASHQSTYDALVN